LVAKFHWFAFGANSAEMHNLSQPPKEVYWWGPGWGSSEYWCIRKERERMSLVTLPQYIVPDPEKGQQVNDPEKTRSFSTTAFHSLLPNP